MQKDYLNDYENKLENQKNLLKRINYEFLADVLMILQWQYYILPEDNFLKVFLQEAMQHHQAMSYIIVFISQLPVLIALTIYCYLFLGKNKK